MMKKKLAFLIPLLAVGLSSCVLYNGQGKPGKSSSQAPASTSQPSGDSSVTPPDPSPHEIPDDSSEGQQITVYLVFGQYGKYEGELVNTNEESLFLEHVKKVENAVVGSDLPGKDKVTSSVSGSEFKTWVIYKNDGKLTEYTKVPAIDNAILYATFSGGQGGGSQGGGSQGGGGSGGGSSTTEFKPSSNDAADTPTIGFGFVFSGAHTTYMAGEKCENLGDYIQYKLVNRAFKKGQEFSFYDFENSAPFMGKVDPYSFAGSSDHEEWPSYLEKGTSSYKVLKDFNISAAYLKMKPGDDQVYFALA